MQYTNPQHFETLQVTECKHIDQVASIKPVLQTGVYKIKFEKPYTWKRDYLKNKTTYTWLYFTTFTLTTIIPRLLAQL